MVLVQTLSEFEPIWSPWQPMSLLSWKPMSLCHRNKESDLVTMTTERDHLTLEVTRLTVAMEGAELKEKELIDQLKQAEEEIAKRDQVIT